MSAREPQVARRDPPSHVLAGLLAAAAIFASLTALVTEGLGLVSAPGSIGPGTLVVALLAAAMGGPHRRLAGWAVGITTASWIAMMVIAVVFNRPLF